MATVPRMELFLIRHAQPRWAVDGLGVNNPTLTSLGTRQAELLARQAATWGTVSELLVSTATRSRDTASPLVTVLDAPMSVHEWLHELYPPPEWEGSPVDQVVKVIAEARTRPPEEWWEGLPTGESFRDFHQRVCDGLERALAERGVRRSPDDPTHLWQEDDPNQRLVIVAHGGTNSVILGSLLGLEPVPWEWERFVSLHTGVTILQTEPISAGRIFSLRYFNRVDHLTPEMVTV